MNPATNSNLSHGATQHWSSQWCTILRLLNFIKICRHTWVRTISRKTVISLKLTESCMSSTTSTRCRSTQICWRRCVRRLKKLWGKITSNCKNSLVMQSHKNKCIPRRCLLPPIAICIARPRKQCSAFRIMGIFKALIYQQMPVLVS